VSAATRVTSHDDAGIVTPQTMAVAAASALSPKFSKLLVTGWPAGERERAELVAFVHDVERDASTLAQRRASRQLSLSQGALRRTRSGADMVSTLRRTISGNVPAPGSPGSLRRNFSDIAVVLPPTAEAQERSNTGGDGEPPHAGAGAAGDP
jgi:hypothetical protein